MSQQKQKAHVIKEFATSAHDTGSAQVQVALLTHRVKEVSEHLVKNPKDVASKKGLLQMVATRRKFLEYLKKHDIAQYKTIVSRLGLRK